MKLYDFICFCFHGVSVSRRSSRVRACACHVASFLLHVPWVGQRTHCKESEWSSIFLLFEFHVSSTQRYHFVLGVIPTVCHWRIKFMFVPIINQFQASQSPRVLIINVIGHTCAHRRHSVFLLDILYNSKAWNSASMYMRAADCVILNALTNKMYLAGLLCNIRYVYRTICSLEHQGQNKRCVYSQRHRI